MLKVEKRHRKDCRYSQYDRAHAKCTCAYRAIGMLNGVFVRRGLKTSNYEIALKKVRAWDAEGSAREAQAVTIEAATGAFMRDIGARNWQDSTKRKFGTLLEGRLLDYAARVGYRLWSELDLNAITEFRATWEDAPLTALKNIERLRAFFRFCVDRDWVAKNPASKLKVKPGRQASGQGQPANLALAKLTPDRFQPRLSRVGQPDADRPGPAGGLRRGYPHHGGRYAVDADDAPDHPRVRSEPCVPDLFAQDSNLRRTRHPAILGTKKPAQPGALGPVHGEKVTGDQRRRRAGKVVVSQSDFGALPGGQMAQGPRPGAEGEILLAGSGARSAAPPIQRKHARERGRFVHYSPAEGDVIQNRENYQ